NTAAALLADLLAEQGRQELLAGQPARAAVFLAEAQARSREPGVGLRSLLADAMHSIDAQRFSLESDGGDLHDAAFSPDGKSIVTAGEDGTAKLWDSATGIVVATLSGHRGAVESAS